MPAQPELDQPHRQGRHVQAAGHVADEPGAILGDARDFLDLIKIGRRRTLSMPLHHDSA